MENSIHGVNILRIFVKTSILLYFMEIGDTVPEFNCFMINSICRFISGWSSLIKHRRISSIPYIKVTKKDNLYFNI